MLAVTFTRKAAGELVDRVGALGVEGVTAGTFHALALAQLRRRAPSSTARCPPCSRRRPASSGRSLGIAARGRSTRPRSPTSRPRSSGPRPASFGPSSTQPRRARPAGGRPGPFADVADIYARYEAEKRTKRTYDFDDLLWLCADAIEEDPTFAATQRWRFRHVFVDEFQDATPLQLRLLRAWLGAGPDLCVVGDAAQAIYGFAGADATPLLAFADHFPGGTVIALDRNYRSTPQVVAVAESVLAPDTAARGREIVAVRPGGPAPTTRGVRRRRRRSDRGRAGMLGGVHVRRAVVRDRCALPHERAVVAVRSRAHPPRHPVPGPHRRSLRRATGRPHAARRAAQSRTGNARAARSQSSWPTSPSGSADDPEATADRRGRDDELREHRDALLRLGRDYLASEGGTGSVAGFVAWLDLATRSEQRGGPAVDLLTFHRAKGLEWRVVFVTGLELGLVPISWATAAGGRRRGTAPAPRRARPGRGRAPPLVGPATDGERPPERARTEPVAGRPGRPRPSVRGRAGRPAATGSPRFVPRWTRRSRRNRSPAAGRRTR